MRGADTTGVGSFTTTVGVGAGAGSGGAGTDGTDDAALGRADGAE